MRALTLDVFVDAPGVDHSNFKSHDSIFEYDIVFWDAANTLETYALERGNPYYKGAPRLDSHSSVRIWEDILRRRKEFEEFLNMGRILVIFTAPPQQFYFDTGKRDTSGTGKNRHVTILLDSADLQEKAIPGTFEISAGQGRGVSPMHSSFRSLWRTHRDRWCYRAVLDTYPGDPIAVVEGTNKCIGSIRQQEQGGMLVFLPDLEGPDFPDNAVTEDVSGGAPSPEFATEVEVPEVFDPASSDLLEWVRSLRPSSGEAAPPWVHRLQFDDEKDASTRLMQLKEQIADLNRQVEDLEVEQNSFTEWKRLIYSQGDPLERQAIEAFKLLGFDAQAGPEGRADIMLRRGEAVAVVEVKGLSKSAAERNAAQLEKWVSGELAEGVPLVKGILVVNAWRDLPPDLRRDPAFPDQMIDFSTRRNHCLITGLQLLAIARTCMEYPERADSIAEEILQTVGVLPNWDSPQSIFADPETGRQHPVATQGE
ncbi:hypothetical protein [Streptomyces sp. 061-3]|uniref:hypothetical protein n=1 Tax=Streptomyces sp. 061-3 TaxID=2789268 RepID=UPI003980591F